ncbi:hypothetical protein CFP65_3315 [Kitasatospora sp. MMS16-BH015]|uniref:GntR family transcriptional regulator n=1 Tax=Kitasatospora sp. MMS16-BH015 TaxID=2018025 RepID=UPI000CA383BA|nr:GntR family transcriptional regulator [Kitasatospora sp. MMS16-BH015]AUG78115.1 hypothetical protein CFP65_3315 [Kitasatospora sp. MMS16-BH015]
MTDLDPTRPKWPQIAAKITERIDQGVDGYTPGCLITSRMIEDEFSVAKVTAAKVFTELRGKKLVRTEFGMGSYVTDPSER